MSDIQHDNIIQLVSVPIPVLRKELFAGYWIFIRDGGASVNRTTREADLRTTVQDENILEWDIR
jgi:hypothetical protein